MKMTRGSDVFKRQWYISVMLLKVGNDKDENVENYKGKKVENEDENVENEEERVENDKEED